MMSTAGLARMLSLFQGLFYQQTPYLVFLLMYFAETKASAQVLPT